MKKCIGYSILLTILVITVGMGYLPAQASASASLPARQAGDAAYVPGQLIVGFAPSVSLGSIASRAAGLAQAVGVKVLRTDEQGTALLDVGGQRDLPALALTIKRIKGVGYAEPNYIYKAVAPESGAIAPPKSSFLSVAAQPNPNYPNDPALWANIGWKKVGADIVWKDPAPSKTVCLLDSGVDYKHKDLAANVIKGYNFVSDNADPMDDYGSGTHVAGIIAAVRNNAEGFAGVSSGKLVAVKVKDASGTGTLYELAQGIRYCADRSDVGIIDVSSAGVWAQSLQDAVVHAVVDKHKLLVAAAGDGGSPVASYPAGFADTTNPAFSSVSGKVMAVAASGQWTGSSYDYNCKATNSNYGSYINLVAPGTNIYSTFPWDRPFTLNDKYGYQMRYDYWDMDGTSVAAGFVAGTAARAWGYLHNLDAAGLVNLFRVGPTINNNGSCWPASVTNGRPANVAGAMSRGAVQLSVRNAVTGLPLPGATVSVYYIGSSTKSASGVVPSGPSIDPMTGSYVQVPDFADVLDVPIIGVEEYIAKVSAANYTTSPQNVFLGGMSIANADGSFEMSPASYTSSLRGYVPPKSANFTVVGEAFGAPNSYLAVWLPAATPFMVSPKFHATDPTYPDVMPDGSLITFPFARFINSGLYYQAIVIHNRKTDSAVPYYPGTYWVGMSDGLTSGANGLDSVNVSAFVWKDGVIKARVNKGTSCGDSKHWWFPLQIQSPASGTATYPAPAVVCGTINDAPYHP